MKKTVISIALILLTAALFTSCSNTLTGETETQSVSGETAESVSTAAETENTSITDTNINPTETTTVSEEPVYCPVVIGIDCNEAEELLSEMGLNVKIVKEINCRTAQNIVTKQSLSEYDSVTEGKEITITVAEWGENVYLMTSQKSSSDGEADCEFTYTYDENNLIKEVFFSMLNDDGSLIRSCRYTVNYNDDLTEITVHGEDVVNYVVGSFENTCRFEGNCLTKAADGEERWSFNTVTAEDLSEDRYFGYDEECTYTYDENGNITEIKKEYSDGEIMYYNEYTYKAVSSNSIDEKTVLVNEFLLKTIYPASNLWRAQE
ncbi:MAG: PASTA domain-containing protein [Ruminococcus sp.]|nr:PASTA domain-containing protein [Ruminococcus sp.]